VDLQKTLLERSARVPIKRPPTLVAVPDLERQECELKSQQLLRYCLVCTDPLDTKQKRAFWVKYQAILLVAEPRNVGKLLLAVYHVEQQPVTIKTLDALQSTVMTRIYHKNCE
jgi:hypothetical protein